MERPILFSGEMVRAILDGRKTMTRRVVKQDLASGFDEPRGLSDIEAGYPFVECEDGYHSAKELCPYGQPSDHLWVRETFGYLQEPDEHEPIFYRADYSQNDIQTQILPKWKPSIFMPRWSSRITLEITSVRVERLQDISEEDARAEGVECVGKTREFHEPLYKNYFLENNPDRSAKYSFRTLWDSINGKKHPWSSNPFVWVIEFKNIIGGV